MTKKQTQLNYVRNWLSVKGTISRNHCLSVYISRLSAYILELKNLGWEIEGKKSGNDYVYELKSKPHVPQIKIVEKVDSSGKLTRYATYV